MQKAIEKLRKLRNRNDNEMNELMGKIAISELAMYDLKAKNIGIDLAILELQKPHANCDKTNKVSEMP